MTTIVFDFALFQGQFPDFVDPPFTSAIVEAQWNIATCYITNEDYGCLNGTCRAFAINAMTAHLLALGLNTTAAIPGQETESLPGFVKSASIDKVSVNIQEPPDKSKFQWWLSQTPYGAQLSALLSVKSVGGLSVGGSNERGGFRKVHGVF